MKSILIVTEQFTIGGLETHICGEISRLCESNVEVHLATGNVFENTLLPASLASVSHGLTLSAESTSGELVSAINQLRKIIREHSIDGVHVHPFTSIIPAVAAAELERIPYAITLHGPASLASYGPIYDLLIKDVILPNANLIVAVSPEVQRLLSVHATTESVICIPNAVLFSETSDAASTVNSIDQRWLVVSRLDQFKIQGIIDFCSKAKRCKIPGVLIVGDGPAKQNLLQAFEECGLSGYATIIGVSADVPSLMQKCAGVAGMGRVVLEGLASRKTVVLAGYDGVKGVIDVELLAHAAKVNFSGRNLPTIDAESLFMELRNKSCEANVSAVFEAAKARFNDKDAWIHFLGKMRLLSSPTPTVLTGLYHSLSGSTIVGTVPYLYNQEVLDRLGAILCSKNFYDPRLSAAVSLCRQRIGNTSLNQTVAEREGQIANLNQTVAEREGQIANLNQTVAEHEGQIANLNQTVAEREGQIANLNQTVAEREEQIAGCEAYKNDKEIYIAQLRLDLQERNQGITGMNWRISSKIKRLPYYVRASATLIRNRGFGGYIKALRNRLKNRQNGIFTSYIQPPAPPSENLTKQHIPYRPAPLLEGDLVIITGVPFDDIGGGQRAAQLARCALKTGRQVVYVYIYKKFDFETNCQVESDVRIQGLTHLHIDESSPENVLQCVSSRATVIFEFPHPAALRYLRLFNSRGIRTVFELIDDWETSLGGDWFNLDVYRQFVAEARCVVGTAKLLVNRLQELNRTDALYLPNAANEYIFDKYKNYKKPTDLPTGRRRIALYFGSLYGEWFAWDYLQAAAIFNTDIDFVLIGDRPNGKIMPNNVHMIGAKVIDELPGYLAYSDFCLLPFSPGKISDAVSPIKIFEYLFAGKPVVSTNLPEVTGYPGVSIAHTPADFAKICALIETSEQLVRDNDQFISQNSWFGRLDALIGGAQARYFYDTVSAVILIHNNIHIIGRCLVTLLQHCKVYLKEVIVVDNASNDGGAEYVEMNFPTVRVLRNPVNGCSSGRNLGAASATGKYLAFFDSDQWFTSSSCFEEALTILDRDANVGAIGWAAGWFDPNHANLGGMIADYCPNRAMNQAAISKGYRADIGYLGTGGFFTTRTVFDATTGFDIGFDPTCFEDTDLSFQIKQLGLDVCYRDLTGIRHQPHQTTAANSGPGSYTSLFNKNATYFKRKWADYSHFFQDYQE